MKHFLLLMALFGVVAVNTPYFWAVFGMNFTAAKIGTERPDGTMQWSLVGPDAPWPDWIPAVDDAELTVANYDEPSDGYPASGMGYIRPNKPVAAIQLQYAKVLKADGWEVEQYNQSTTSGTIPAREIRICTIVAKKGKHVFWFALYEGEKSQSRLVWNDGGELLAAPTGSESGGC